MHLLLNLLLEIPNVFDPKELISHGGFWLLILIVFAETGLLIGFFLPGDALLFTAGLLCADGSLEYNFWIVLLALNIAAISGNTVGYIFGKRVGLKLFKRKDSILFKKSYIQMSKDFYEKYGGLALVLGRFLPIIRTFAPIVAGVAHIDRLKFFFYNITGSLLWTIAMTGSGFWLAKKFPWIGDHIALITIGMVILASGTLLRTYLKERSKNKAQE